MIPPDASAAFVADMEDVLEVYHRPRDPERPLVCLDETSRQLIAETRTPIPAKPGQPARHDYEYERNGVANLFMMFAPLEGWRHVKVTDRHTAIDYAHVLRELSDLHFPGAAKILLVQDNLNTHRPASLYEAFPRRRSAKARRALRMALHAKAWQLARHGQIRTRRSPRNAWIAVLPTRKSSPARSAHGRITATSTTPKQTGNSQPPTRA